MKILRYQSGVNIEIEYDNDGYFKHVTNIDTGEKMMIEIMLEGRGYTIKENKGYLKMDVCDARYIRIMELDLFIPRFLFIKNRYSMKSIIDFIVNEELTDLEKYPTLIKPLAEKIIDEVIKWENNTAVSDSLEETLHKKLILVSLISIKKNI